MPRQSRGLGRVTLCRDFYEPRPFPYRSRMAHDVSFATVTQAVWERTLSPWAREQLHAPLPAHEDEDDEGRGE